MFQADPEVPVRQPTSDWRWRMLAPVRFVVLEDMRVRGSCISLPIYVTDCDEMLLLHCCGFTVKLRSVCVSVTVRVRVEGQSAFLCGIP